MFYFIIALINLVYGILLFFTLRPQTPGFWLVGFIAAVLTITGLWGFILWLKEIISSQNPNASPAIKSWFQITKGIDILLIAGLLFRSFILQPFMVDGNSMAPNYENGEFLLVDRISYKFHEPQRGEVIIFLNPKNLNEDYIKRLIGLPGETVKIKNGQVFINDRLLTENYLPENTNTFTLKNSSDFIKTIGLNEYFALGDNRSNSSDSREWGMVPKNNIIGRAWFVVYPWGFFGKIKNPPTNLSNLVTKDFFIIYNYFA